MLQAFTAPVLKSVLLGGIVLGAGAYKAATTEPPLTKRLVLHAVEEPNAIYLTAWRNGDVRITVERDSKLKAMTFYTRASVYDGCRWLATERLIPIDQERFVYTYDETILACDPGATPLRKTPRTGLVTVED